MLDLLRGLFGRKEAPAPLPEEFPLPFFLQGAIERPPVDLAKLGEELLRALPRCTAKIVIAGPSYDDKHFKGDVIADTAGLLPWAERDAAGVISSDDVEQAAREILPTWLRGADLGNRSPSLVSAPFRRLLRDYATYFVERDIARVLCYECWQLVSDITRESQELGSDGVFHWWIDEWRCPAGHLLRREKNGISVCIRSKRLKA